MSGYVGRGINYGNLKSQQFTGNGGATYTLSYTTTTDGVVVTLDGVVQVNGTDFDVASNNVLTFTSNVASPIKINVIFIGLTQALGTVNGDNINNTVVAKGDGSSTVGKLKINCEQNSHGITIQSPAHSSGANYTLTLPTTDGNANEILKTDGSGVLSWTPDTDTTNTNASNLTSGTLPDARFPATLPATSGVNLTALNATNLGSGTVPDARFPATLPTASGVNLTSLNASNIGSGTVPTARLGSGTASSSTFLRGDSTYAEAGGGKILQVVNSVYSTESSTTATIPGDATIPQSNEGAALMELAITPSATSSKVLCFASGELGSSLAGGMLMVMLFKNTDANALHVQSGFRDDVAYFSNYSFQYLDSPSSTSQQTYKLRYGSGGGTSYVNRSNDVSGYWGNLQQWIFTLMEIGA